MAAGKIERQFEKGELRGQSSDKSPVTTEKDLKLPLKLLQVYGCVFQTPKSTRRATLGLWVQNWRQVLLLSLADRTRWSDRQLRLKLSCVCGAEVYPRLDELWTKFSKLVLVH